MAKRGVIHCFLVPLCLVGCFTVLCNARQVDNLHSLIKSMRRVDSFRTHFPPNAPPPSLSPPPPPPPPTVFVEPQEGLMESNKIDKLPGQPDPVDFNQYSGYVTVDRKAGRALFYYFVESPNNSSINPLVLWLNGGPGCSSFGYGAMMELGPFRVHSDNTTLLLNPFSWINVANMLFLESPAGVGFSYSNTSDDYKRMGDKLTAEDAYTFLVNWLHRFPQYKNRDFYMAGESYAGHYVPQLAQTILYYNQNGTEGTIIPLKAIIIGNPYIDDATFVKGVFDYLWSHAMISDETYKGLSTSCILTPDDRCGSFERRADAETGVIDDYNIYAPVCHKITPKNASDDSVYNFDPCTPHYIESYLNLPSVQTALHVKPTEWHQCRDYHWADWPSSTLPIFKQLQESDIRIWLYSGDIDSDVPVTATRYAVNSLNLSILGSWNPWYCNDQVGGYAVVYKGLTLTTIRGAGHEVTSFQPERALALITAFLQGRTSPVSSSPVYPIPQGRSRPPRKSNHLNKNA